MSEHFSSGLKNFTLGTKIFKMGLEGEPMDIINSSDKLRKKNSSSFTKTVSCIVYSVGKETDI